MCIIAVAAGCHPNFPLVCIHNREEVLDRPTTQCRVDPSNSAVICARDDLAGGTWMGINTLSGVFCSLTNLRATNPPRESPASRGLLVKELLEEEPTGSLPTEIRSGSAEALRSATQGLRAATSARNYEGLNLCVGGWHPTPAGRPPAVFYVSNVPPAAGCESGSKQWQLAFSRGWTVHTDQLAPGVAHAWSNDAPSAGAWPKSTWLRSHLARLLASTPHPGAPAPSAQTTTVGPNTSGAAVIDMTGLSITQEPAAAAPGSTPTPLPPTTATLLRELCALLSTTNDYTDAELPADFPAFSPLLECKCSLVID